jgi:hypothetical protein
MQIELEQRVGKFARRRTPLSESDARLQRSIKRLSSAESLRTADLLLASHGFTRETVFTEKLTDEQHDVIWETPIQEAITPRLREAAKLPHSDLHIAAKSILARSPSGKGLSVRALAGELKISRMTLYRNFGKDNLRAVLNFALKQAGELPSERVATGRKCTVHRDKEAPRRPGQKRR